MIDVSTQGHTLTVIHGTFAFHFRKERNTLELKVVDELNTNNSIPGELVEIPESVEQELGDYYIA